MMLAVTIFATCVAGVLAVIDKKAEETFEEENPDQKKDDKNKKPLVGRGS